MSKALIGAAMVAVVAAAAAAVEVSRQNSQAAYYSAVASQAAAGAAASGPVAPAMAVDDKFSQQAIQNVRSDLLASEIKGH